MVKGRVIVQRTLWAERYFNSFSSRPLTAECVFCSPQYTDRGKQKEVCDFLLVLRGKAILVSMKSQDDPSSRRGDRLRRWTIKNATHALNQAKGALGTIVREPFWCKHPRRGRVAFKQGLISVAHVVVLTEVLGDVVELPSELPLMLDTVPVAYLSLNDFLNLINELRAFPDITAYLDARRTLPNKSLRSVGHELLFYKYYALNEGTLAGCNGYADARISSAARDAEWQSVVSAGESRHKSASIVEFVSDALATRLKNFSAGLDVETIAQFEPTDDRKHYLLMQEELCDLRLSERVALGQHFLKIMGEAEKSETTETMAYMAFHTDSKPDFVYVLVSARGIDRATVIGRCTILLRAAMATYGKDRGMVIADRDGAGFEVQLIARRSTDPNDERLSEEFFTKLRVSPVPAS
jgi:hypothetical protein